MPGTTREGIDRITAKLLCQANPANLTKFYSINVTGMNGSVPKQSSAITRSNTAVTPLSSNSSSYLFHPTPVINHLSLPTNSNSSASSDSSGSHPNGNSSKHHGGYCTYTDYKSNVIRWVRNGFHSFFLMNLLSGSVDPYSALYILILTEYCLELGL